MPSKCSQVTEKNKLKFKNYLHVNNKGSEAY